MGGAQRLPSTSCLNKAIVHMRFFKGSYVATRYSITIAKKTLIDHHPIFLYALVHNSSQIHLFITAIKHYVTLFFPIYRSDPTKCSIVYSIHPLSRSPYPKRHGEPPLRPQNPSSTQYSAPHSPSPPSPPSSVLRLHS